MQQRDERRAAARPSLLSSEQQAEADRNRILRTMDGDGAKPAGARSSVLRWAVAGLVVVAVFAGAAVWMGGKEVEPMHFSSAAPAPAVQPVAAAPLPEKVAEVQPEPEVSAAAILEDTPAIAEKEKSLKEMLAAPSPSTASPTQAHNELSKILEATPAHTAATADKTSHSNAVAKKPHVQKAPVIAKKVEPAPKAAPRVDSDVTLLAALVAHSHARPAADRSSAAQKLKQCKQMSAADAEQCRDKLCSGTAKDEAECKAPSAEKANAAS